MNEVDHILARLQAVEASLNAQHQPKDYGDAIKALGEQISSVKGTAEAALVRRIPSVAGLVTQEEMLKHLEAVSESLVDGVVEGERLVTEKLTRRIEGSLGEIARDVSSSKSVATANATSAMSVIRQACTTFGKIA